MAISSGMQWDIRTTGSDTNGGGYSSGGTDYSQQNSAQLSLTDVVANGTTTLTSATGGFTSAMIGNTIYLQGGSGVLTATRREVTGRTDTNTITVDASVASGTGITGNIGGSLATPAEPFARGCVSGNTVWIKNGTYTTAAKIVPTGGVSGLIVQVFGYNNTHGDLSSYISGPWINASAAIGTHGILSLENGYNCVGFLNFWANGNAVFRAIYDAGYCTIMNCFASGSFTGEGIGSGAWPSQVLNSDCDASSMTAPAASYCTARGTINTQNAYKCIAYNTGGTNKGFIRNQAGSANWTECTAVNCGGDGFYIDTTTNARTITMNKCLSINNGGYGYNQQTNTNLAILINCAAAGNTSGSKNNIANAELGTVTTSTLLGNPFVGPNSRNFSLNYGSGILKIPYIFNQLNLTTDYSDIGAVQRQDDYLARIDSASPDSVLEYSRTMGQSIIIGNYNSLINSYSVDASARQGFIFTSDRTESLTACRIAPNKIGSPSIRFYLYNCNDELNPSGSILTSGSTSTFDVSTDLVFSPPYTVTSGSRYIFVVENTHGTPASNYWQLFSYPFGDSAQGVLARHAYNSGSAYFTASNSAVFYRIYSSTGMVGSWKKGTAQGTGIGLYNTSGSRKARSGVRVQMQVPGWLRSIGASWQSSSGTPVGFNMVAEIYQNNILQAQSIPVDVSVVSTGMYSFLQPIFLSPGTYDLVVGADGVNAGSVSAHPRTFTSTIVADNTELSPQFISGVTSTGITYSGSETTLSGVPMVYCEFEPAYAVKQRLNTQAPAISRYGTFSMGARALNQADLRSGVAFSPDISESMTGFRYYEWGASAGTLTNIAQADLYLADANNLPIGGSLATATFTPGSYTYRDVTWNTPYTVVAGTWYCIVMKNIAGTPASNYWVPSLTINTSESVYPLIYTGQMYFESTNGGSTYVRPIWGGRILPNYATSGRVGPLGVGQGNTGGLTALYNISGSRKARVGLKVNLPISGYLHSIFGNITASGSPNYNLNAEVWLNSNIVGTSDINTDSNISGSGLGQWSFSNPLWLQNGTDYRIIVTPIDPNAGSSINYCYNNGSSTTGMIPTRVVGPVLATTFSTAWSGPSWTDNSGNIASMYIDFEPLSDIYQTVTSGSGGGLSTYGLVF